MKSVRLLPIVIFAAVALLVFKGVGLVTNGGYVLLGTTTAEAAGGGGGESHGGGSGATEGVVDDGFTSMTDPTMADSAPTADDGAPTLPLGAEESAAGHGAAAPAAGHDAPAEGDHAEAAETELDGETPVPAEGAEAAMACPPETEGAAAVDHGGAAPADGHSAEAPIDVACAPPLTTADGDGVPMVQDATGQLVPFAGEASSAGAVEERLGERRADLDTREQEFEMRMALVEAAEKRINERTAVLQQLEARINSLVDQNKEAEEGQFKSIVSMYETMKPKEAALIFDELDMNTLLRVARAMNPRKMAPIMAKMTPTKAKDLTASMAVTPVEPTVAVTSEDLAALPQIVGQ